MKPAVGKSGPGIARISLSSDVSGSSIIRISASQTSPRLCGGMLVAMPTAMPEAPLMSRFGNFAGSTERLALGAVVVRHPVDGLLVDVVLQHLLGELGQADLGVAHRRRVVAVDRAEVALTVDQQVAQREVLRHAHDRVVDRRVAVRVVLAHDVADDAGRLLVRLVRQVPRLEHAVEHPPVHRLQAVAHVGQRPPDDHAHRVVEVAPLHLLFDVDRHRPLERQHRVLGHSVLIASRLHRLVVVIRRRGS